METIQEKHGIVLASDLRRILDTDNTEIKNLCKKLKVYPKRDKRTGKAFFMREDVDFLKRIKELHAQSSDYALMDGERSMQNPIKTANPGQSQIQPQFQDNSKTILAVVNEFKGVIEKMVESQDNLLEKMQSTLENKLDGLDEVVVELIQVKTENESLRLKLNKMTKENYELKNTVESFKPVGFGFYVK